MLGNITRFTSAAALSTSIAFSAQADDNARTYTNEDINFVFITTGERYDLRMEDNHIYLKGSITSDSIERIKDYLDRLARDRKFEDATLVLDSTGGSVSAGYELVDHVRQMNLPVNIRCDRAKSMAFMLCINDVFASAAGSNNSKGVFHFSYTIHSFNETDLNQGAPAKGWNFKLDDYRSFLNELDNTGQNSIIKTLPDAKITFTRKSAEAALRDLEESGQDFIVVEFARSDSSDYKSRSFLMTEENLQTHLDDMDAKGAEETQITLSGLSMTFTREQIERQITKTEDIHQRFVKEVAEASTLTESDVASLQSDFHLSGIQMHVLGLFDHYNGPASEIDKIIATVLICEDEPQLSICDI